MNSNINHLLSIEDLAVKKCNSILNSIFLVTRNKRRTKKRYSSMQIQQQHERVITIYRHLLLFFAVWMEDLLSSCIKQKEKAKYNNVLINRPAVKISNVHRLKMKVFSIIMIINRSKEKQFVYNKYECFHFVLII